MQQLQRDRQRITGGGRAVRALPVDHGARRALVGHRALDRIGRVRERDGADLRATRQRIGTGILNRLLRQIFEANPPPLVRGRRLKLFYAAQTSGKGERQMQPPEFVLFVNDPLLMNETYRRYLEARIRKAEPYPGLPIILTLRPRARNMPETKHRLHSSGKASPRGQLHRV